MNQEESVYQEFGQILRVCREARGMTQQQLADNSDFSRTSISNIESGKQRVLLHQIYEFATILGVPSQALLPFGSKASVKADNQNLASLPDNEKEFARLFGI